MDSKFNMNWNDIPSNSNQQMDFLRLEQGTNQMRIVSSPSQMDIHWENDINGGKRKIICLGVKCPICKKGEGHTPQTRYQIQVIDRKDGKIKVLECGKQIIKSIKDYAVDSDYGDPTQYDIKIKKEGSGRDTKYSVMPVPSKYPLTPEEEELVKNAPTIVELNKIKTEEEILAMPLTIFADSIADLAQDDDDDFDLGDDTSWDDLDDINS